MLDYNLVFWSCGDSEVAKIPLIAVGQFLSYLHSPVRAVCNWSSARSDEWVRWYRGSWLGKLNTLEQNRHLLLISVQSYVSRHYKCHSFTNIFYSKLLSYLIYIIELLLYPKTHIYFILMPINLYDRFYGGKVHFIVGGYILRECKEVYI